MFLLDFLLGDELHDEEVDAIEGRDIQEEQEDDDQGVEDPVSVDEVIEDVVGSAIAAHEEHVVVGESDVDDVGDDAEGDQNQEGDGDVFLLHAHHAGEGDVNRCEARDGVGDAGIDIIEGENGIGGEVLASAVVAHGSAQDAEDQDEVQAGFLHPSLGESRQRDGDELDAAKEQRQVIEEMSGGVIADGDHDDSQDIEEIDDETRPHQDAVLGFFVLMTEHQAKPNAHEDHDGGQNGHEKQMLPGKIPFWCPLVSSESKKFAHIVIKRNRA